jgi:hypothetical protein
VKLNFSFLDRDCGEWRRARAVVSLADGNSTESLTDIDSAGQLHYPRTGWVPHFRVALSSSADDQEREK